MKANLCDICLQKGKITPSFSTLKRVNTGVKIDYCKKHDNRKKLEKILSSKKVIEYLSKSIDNCRSVLD